MVADATTVNISSRVPIPPGRATNTSLCSIRSCLRSVRSEHGICTSSHELTFPRSSTFVGTTPMVMPLLDFAAFDTHSINPILHPPNTMTCPFCAAHCPSSSVLLKYSASILSFAEQKIPIFMLQK